MSHPRLTKKQEAFAVAVAKGKNASEAYRAAYDAANMADNTVWNTASILLKNPKVAARVDELTQKALAKSELSVERALREVSSLSFSDISAFYDEDGALKPLHEIPPEARAAIAGIETEEIREEGIVVGRRRKVKLWDKNSALDKAMKHLGLYAKDNEQSKAPPPPVQVQIVMIGAKP